MSFTFDPTTGLLDVNTYPRLPANQTEARQQFQGLFDQIKAYLNKNAIYCLDTGTADALAVTLAPVPTVYSTDMFLIVKKSAAANTGATTINVNSLGVKSVKKDVNVALGAADMPASGVLFLQYDGTNFQLLNPAKSNALDAHMADYTKHFRSVKDYGAVGNGTTDDTAAIQATIDAVEALGGGIVFFPYSTYKTTATLTVNEHNIKLYGANAVIAYTGTSYVIDFQPKSSVYLIGIAMEDLSIGCSGAGATGIRWRCTHSKINNVDVVIQGSNSVGAEIPGDATGTGPYYNFFTQLDVQGYRGITVGLTNQIGINLFHTGGDNSPNANTFVNCRVGQCDTGFHIEGSGNMFLNPVTEGVITAHFDINHADSAVGCTDNTIIAPYCEGAITSTVFAFGANSIRTAVNNIFGTGTGGLYTDAGTDNSIYWPGSGGKVIIPAVDGLILKSKTAKGIFQYVGNPEGAVTADPGSICLSDDGKLYKKSTGSESTGWVEMIPAYTLPTASVSVLGGVKVGAGLSIDGSSVLSATGFKVGSFTIDMTTASGTQAITGVGFQPRAIMFFATCVTTAHVVSSGVDDAATARVMFDYNNISANAWQSANASSITALLSGSDVYSGKVNSFDADGFTIGWTKTGSPTGTLTINYIAFK
jgi:hypothetical protein